MIDMHSHILPGLDDGATDWDEALAMARVAVEDGIAEMVCTPHWVLGKYENDRETVLLRFAEFEERLAAEKIPLKIHTGTELRIDTSIPDRLKDGRLLTLNNGSGYVLLELPDETMPENLHEFFWNLQINGYRPILSHVERNPYFRENPHRLVHMLVTDTHSLQMRKPQLSGARRVIENLAGPETATRMVCDTPRRILKGEHVPVIDPLPLHEERRKKWWQGK